MYADVLAKSYQFGNPKYVEIHLVRRLHWFTHLQTAEYFDPVC